MRDITFQLATKVYFGAGVCRELGGILGRLEVKKVFIATDRNIAAAGILDQVRAEIEKAGLSWEVSTDLMPEPESGFVDEMAELLRESGAEAVVAVGGGSALDTAKALAVLQTNEGSISDYLFGADKTLEKPGIPLICIPTTAGTGSEITPVAVFENAEKRVKLSVKSDLLLPCAALIDPLLQTGLPPAITAATGMDAMTHAIEAYVCTAAQPVSDAFALQAVKMIVGSLRRAVEHGNDVEARGNMALASCLAALAFSNSGLGAVHGIAQAIGGVAHISHGVANAVMLPHVMKRNLKGAPERFRDLAAAMGEQTAGLGDGEAAELAVEAVEKLMAPLPIPGGLADPQIGIRSEQFPDIIRETMAYRMLSLNPCQLNENDIRDILMAASRRQRG